LDHQEQRGADDARQQLVHQHVCDEAQIPHRTQQGVLVVLQGVARLRR
jgi:hypothetical protein